MNNKAPIILRIGISLVVLWFGFSQGLNPSKWIGILPHWTLSLPITQISLIYINSWFEIIFGLCLITGFYTRLTAIIIAIHLLDITFTVGYGAIGVRDFGLTMAAISIALYGMDSWSIDKLFIKNGS